MVNDILGAENAIGLLECGRDRGTAFLLTSDLILTCRHCILAYFEDESAIRFTLANKTYTAEISSPDIPDEHDAVILKLSEPIADASSLPLMASHLPRGLSWTTFGFPGVRGRQGMIIGGKVSRTVADSGIPYDVDLECEGFDLPSRFNGFSGSPVIIEGSVRGILQVRSDGALGAISIARLSGYLELASVEFRSFGGEAYLHPALEQELEETIPNWRTLGRIEEEVAGRPRGYLLLSGHPGAGKTLISAGFQPTSPDMTVVGRYFAAGHPGSELPAALQRRLDAFAQWLSTETALRSKAAVAVNSDASVTDFVKSVARNLTALASIFTDGSVGVLIIDGIDEAPNDSHPDFLQFLPPEPPTGLAIILTTTDSEATRKRLDHLTIHKTLITDPLPIAHCEQIALRKLAPDVPFSQIARVAELSEGNPLALSYYLRDISAAMERGETDPWASLDGGPTDYYLRVWDRITQNSAARYMLSLLARARGPIPQNVLLQMIPQTQKVDSVDALRQLRYLLRFTDDGIRFYHESFRGFVLEQTESLEVEIHTAISNHCISQSDTDYSSANLLYHHSRSASGREGAAELCTQDWFDEAAARCIPPELLLSDLSEILAERLRAGDVLQSLRLLLLRGRLSFRYNRMFVQHAALFSEAAVVLRSPSKSLQFVIRQGHIVCGIDDILSLLRSLLLSDHVPHAQNLYRELRSRFWAAFESGPVGYDVVIDQMVATQLAAIGDVDTRDSSVSELQFLHRLLFKSLKDNGFDDVDRNSIKSYLFGTLGGESMWARGFAASTGNDPLEMLIILETSENLLHQNGYVEHPDHRPDLPEPFEALGRDDVAERLRSAALSGNFEGEIARRVSLMLMRTTDAFDLTRSLFAKSIPCVREASLRAKNGVDPNFPDVKLIRLAWEISGFTNDASIPKRLEVKTRHGWEQRLVDAITWLGLTNGQLFRSKTGQGAASQLLFSRIRAELLPLIGFTLAERSEWEDSYHLPEYIIPAIIAHAATMIKDHEPSSISEFADTILDYHLYQFGIYNEGYIRLLSSTANVLATVPGGRTAASDIYRHLHDFISRNIFARQERIAGLLDCAKHLGRLGATEAAEQSFREAIGSSLGPNWYKEAQFVMLIDALAAVDDPEFTLSQLSTIVGLLANASGDSTFQRYIRDAKESLIGHLSANGQLAQALATYLHYLHPDFKLQKSRIESIDVDRTSGLYSGRFGVQEIDEQQAALELLRGLGNASPLRRWSILELFWPWGDERYSADFARHFVQLLTTEQAEVIGERFLMFLRVEVAPDNRTELIRTVSSQDVDQIAEPWIRKAIELGIIADPDRLESESVRMNRDGPGIERSEDAESNDDRELFMPGIFGRRQALDSLRASLDLARGRIARSDMQAARTHLLDGLRTAQAGGWSIWEGGGNVSEALESLLLETGSIQQGLGAIADLVLEEEHEEYWRMAHNLMTTLMPRLDQSDRRALFSIVSDHTEFLVAPERRFCSIDVEADAIAGAPDPINPDDCIESLLCYLLDHPNVHMQERAALVMLWLWSNSQFTVNRLVDRIAADVVGDGKEIAIGILQNLVDRNPGLSCHIKSMQSFEVVRRDPHFHSGFLVENVLGCQRDIAQPTFSSSSSLGDPEAGEAFDAELLSLLDLDKGSDATARSWLREIAEPFTAVDIRDLVDIRRRAYGGLPRHRASAHQREAVFRALGTSADAEIRRRLLDTSLWNPRWPDCDARIAASFLLPAVLAKLERPDGERPFAVDEWTILHCHEVRPPERGQAYEWREATAVLVCKEYYQGPPGPDDLWRLISVFETEPSETGSSMIVLPSIHAVARFEPGFKVGGDFTPAIPSRHLVQLLGSDVFDRFCWNDGRRWDSWGPGPKLSRGTALMVKTEALKSITDYDIVWVVLQHHMPTHIYHERKGLILGGDHEYREDE